MKLKTLSVSFSFGILMALTIAPATAQKKPVPTTNKEAASSIHRNSLNAPSIIQVFDEIYAKIKNVKEDPFDPNHHKNLKSTIYNEYTNKLIYIPTGNDSEQKLSGLNFNTNDQAIVFYPFDYDSSFRYLGYYYKTGSDSCGAEQYQGYTVVAAAQLKNTGSDFGTTDSERGRNLSYDRIKINISTSQIRPLSGNIERYVSFKNLREAYSPRYRTWEKGGSCTSIDLTNQLIGTFEYHFKVKNTGKNLLTLETLN